MLVGEPITFTKEDNQGILFLHNDAVVISLNIKNYNVYCILIDNGSLIDVLYYDAFVQIGISFDRLERVDSLMIDFTRVMIQVEGAITLLVKMG